uniref:ABC transporter ATP-binding protein n=1 Tax=Ignisphaera aggregans TaxID=334771 RepID=A0A7C5XM53_9CREN
MKPLEVKKLTVEYMMYRGWVEVVSNADLEINERDEILAIVGESGCGKTTLGLTIAGLLPSNARVVHGYVKVFGKDVNSGSAKVAMIFQDALTSLNPLLTVGDQIAEIYIHHFAMSKKEAFEEAMKRLAEVGLQASFINKYPHELSGGQRQRVLIAMVIALRPELIVADEPTTALDVTTQAKVLNLLKSIVKGKGIPMVYITHDLALVAHIADKIAVMYAGQVVEYREKLALFKDPLHLYTQALLSSLPRVDVELSELRTIRGEPPVPGNFPKGCRFSPRCPKAFSRCFVEEPRIKNVGNGYVRCHLYE